MTISSQSNIVTYNGDSVTQNFPVFFYWLANAHLKVTRITVADGSRLLLTDGVDYIATGAGNLNGGNVATTALYSNAYQIEIKRTVPIIQPDNYVAGSILPAETVEKDFDYGIMVSQQLDQRLGSIEQSGAGGGIVIVNLPGSGVGLYANQVGSTYNFKKLIGAGDLTITDAGTELLLSVGGVTGALKIVNNLTDVADRQASLNNLTAAFGGGNEYVLTRDTVTGNAVWKPAAGGGGGGPTPPGTTHQFYRGDGTWAAELKDAFSLGPYNGGAALVISDSSNAPGIWINQKGANANARLFRIGSGNSGGNAQLSIATFDDTGTSGFHFPFVLNRLGNTPTTLSLMADSGRLLVGPSSDDTATMFQLGGSMRFDGTGRALSADTQNATLANQFVFQDSQANAATTFNVVPNGSGANGRVNAFNAFPITNAAYVSMAIGAAQAVINSGHNGTGVTLPLVFMTDGVERMRISVAGAVTIGGAGLPVVPTGTGFPHIVAGVQDAAAKLVDTADINASQVTYAKIQNISATAMVLGRSSAGAGVVQEVPFTTFLQTAGGTMNGTLTFAYPQVLLFSGNGTNPKKYLRADSGQFQIVNDAFAAVIWALDNAGNVNQYGTLNLQNFDLDNARTVTFNSELDDGTSGTAKTIDFTAGQYHKISMTGACTFTFTPPPGPAVVHLKLTQDGTGSRVMTLPAGKWPGVYAAADKLLSTAIGAIDLLTAKWDGAAWFYTLAKAWA